MSNLKFMPDAWMDKHATMGDVATKFQETADYSLPVFDEGMYVGFISRAKIFSA